MAGARNDIKLVVGGEPRAELLPPELALEKKAASQRRSLVALVVVVVAAVAVAYGASSVLTLQSQARLDELNAESASLLAQQGEYIEVRQLAAQVDAAQSASLIAVEPEIDWASLLDLLSSKSSNIGLVQISATAETPLTPFEQSTIVFERTRVAALTFTGVALTQEDIANWIEALGELPEVADTSLTSIENVEGTLKFILVIHITDAAFSHRLEDAAADAADDAAADDASTEEDSE